MAAPPPPTDKQFKAGQSGNPGGRPRGEGRVRENARAHTAQALAVLVEAMEDPDKRVAIRAAEILLDRGWGKAPQALSGEDGEGPAELIIKWLQSAK